MGLDIYDVMSGVGNALSVVGDVKQEDRKTKLAEKLQIEREAREESRTVAREKRAQDREAGIVKSTKIVTGEGGSFWEEQYNSSGEVINRKLANQMDIENINRDRKKDDLSLEAVLANINQSRAQTDATYANIAEGRAKLPLETELLRAQTGSYNRANTPESRAPRKEKEEDPDKEFERNLLAQARSKIAGGMDVQKVADYLRAKGYPRLAKELEE